MTAIWQVDEHIFRKNVRSVKGNNAMMAVVKNNAYNYGLDFAVKAFLEEGINTFSTTSLSEAIRIRSLAPHATIFLMNVSYDFDSIRKYQIHMTLPSAAFYFEYKSQLYDIHVHLEYENLLHRSGLKNLEEIQSVLKDHTKNQKNKMIISGLWTHFGYADEFDVNDYEIEKKLWLELVTALLNEGYTFDFIHAQNSASYMREEGIFPDHTHARIGIALYGSRPYAALPRQAIQQALTLRANVIQIRTIHKDEHCGYSFAFTASKNNTKLAVVDIGYGDGVLRTRAQYEVLINGQSYPIRALMMSHMFVEVDDSVKAQDDVILYNETLRIDDYTFKGVGANSEQLSALNLDSLIKEYR